MQDAIGFEAHIHMGLAMVKTPPLLRAAADDRDRVADAITRRSKAGLYDEIPPASSDPRPKRRYVENEWVSEHLKKLARKPHIKITDLGCGVAGACNYVGRLSATLSRLFSCQKEG